MNASARMRGALVVAALASCLPWGVRAQSPAGGSAAQSDRFPVKTVKVQGNTLLPDSELAALTAGLIGSERTLGDLKKVAAALQEAYRRAGYGGVVAYVPEQDLAAGDIVIRVAEGKLARVSITGNRRYDEANIRASLPGLREGETPVVRAIDRDIQLANENPVKELRVTLTAGAKPGEIDANIEVAEAEPLRVLVGLDNTGNPATGIYRLSIGLQHANLWNRDHIGTLQYQTSPTDPEQVQIYSLGYRLPLYGHASSIDAFVAHSNVDNGTTLTTAGPLLFTGKGDVAGLRLNRYLDRIGEYDHRLTLGLDWRAYDNSCSVGEFGSAGCGTAGVSVRVLPVSLAYTGQVEGPERTWGYFAALAQNVGGSSEETFEAARPGAKRYYTILRASTYGGVTAPARFGLQGRVSGQYSPDALVPGEQFGLGGAGSVRGYREREVAGDYGYVVNLDGLAPDWRIPLGETAANLRPLIFFDYGWIGNHKDAPCEANASTCVLASAGVGARFLMGTRASGRIDVGYALKDSPQTSASTIRANFALQLVF